MLFCYYVFHKIKICKKKLVHVVEQNSSAVTTTISPNANAPRCN